MRSPLVGVRRDHGARYLLVTIVAFAITVIGTRVFLDLSGYPKVGGGGLHVAHLLWGGLLLVVALLLVQLMVGQRVLLLSALAGGIGVGLFIDEVGKFLTETNDYFFAPAAPIIYGSILLLVLVWLRFRRDRVPSDTEAVQGAIEAVRSLADGRLTRGDRDRAVSRLQAARPPATSPLALDLAGILGSSHTESRLATGGRLDGGTVARLARRLLPDRLERFLIRAGLLLIALSAVLWLLVLLVVLGGGVEGPVTTRGPIEHPEDPVWLALLALVWVVVGVVAGVALVLSLTGRHGRAMEAAQYAVLAGLIAGGLLNLYVSQLEALGGVLLQFLLLLMILDQRSRLPSTGSTAG
jgi:hypothetical protein